MHMGQNLQDYQNSILGWLMPTDGLRSHSNSNDVHPTAGATFESQDSQNESFKATAPSQHNILSPEGTLQELEDPHQMRARLLEQRNQLMAMNAALKKEVKDLSVSLETMMEERNALQHKQFD